MLTDSHGDPFLRFQTILVIWFRRLDFDEHVIPIILKAERRELCRGYSNSTTRFDRVQEELCDGNWHCHGHSSGVGPTFQCWFGRRNCLAGKPSREDTAHLRSYAKTP
jgi:hypothetical protein